MKKAAENPKIPAVIGAVISLGHCLDLTDYGSSRILKTGYEILKVELSNYPLKPDPNWIIV